MLMVVQACLVLGVGLVACGLRPSPLAGLFEKLGGMLVVIGLIGLGVLLARARG